MDDGRAPGDLPPPRDPAPVEALSVFDMLKIGVGPSSSHTLGPWRAVQRWLAELEAEGVLGRVEAVRVHLYGSLALTGRGHCTDQAVMLALLGHDPETVPVDEIPALVAGLAEAKRVPLGGRAVPFDPAADIVFHPRERLPGHANGMTCVAVVDGAERASDLLLGRGRVRRRRARGGAAGGRGRPAPAPGPGPGRDAGPTAGEHACRIADVVWRNEQAWRPAADVRQRVLGIWDVMREGVFRGCHTEGTLPGGLGVERRAAPIARRLLGPGPRRRRRRRLDRRHPRPGRTGSPRSCSGPARSRSPSTRRNANLGRVVTARDERRGRRHPRPSSSTTSAFPSGR